jgi:hypothetical protein
MRRKIFQHHWGGVAVRPDIFHRLTVPYRRLKKIKSGGIGAVSA